MVDSDAFPVQNTPSSIWAFKRFLISAPRPSPFCTFVSQLGIALYAKSLSSNPAFRIACSASLAFWTGITRRLLRSLPRSFRKRSSASGVHTAGSSARNASCMFSLVTCLPNASNWVRMLAFFSSSTCWRTNPSNMRVKASSPGLPTRLNNLDIASSSRASSSNSI